MAKSANGSGLADILGSYATSRSWMLQPQWPPPSETDRELLEFAEEVRAFAESVSNLVRCGGTPDGLRPENLDAAKRDSRRRLERAVRALYGVRDEDGAPYRDARMLLVDWLLLYGREVRRLRDGDGASPHSRLAEKSLVHMGARNALDRVAALYPSLGPKMAEPGRFTGAAKAIVVTANSPWRLPWQHIAAVWKGIDSNDPDPERWRKDWHEHRRRMDRAADQNRPNQGDGQTA